MSLVYLSTRQLVLLVPQYRGTDNPYILQRSVVGITLNVLDAVNHIHTFYHLTEHRIGSIEMWRAAHGGIHILHLLRHPDTVAEEFFQILTSPLQSLLALPSAVDDIKLRTVRPMLRIDIIGFAGCCQRSALSEY